MVQGPPFRVPQCRIRCQACCLKTHIKRSLMSNTFWTAGTDSLPFKALANEDTLLATQMFPCLPAHATFVADTNFVSGTQKMFLILFRNILCLQQMFPSLRSPRNIMGNNVSATMCPRLLGPLATGYNILI